MKVSGLSPVAWRTSFAISLLMLQAPGLVSAGQPHDPVADPRAVVLSDQVRFTVLTPSLLRMEWSPAGLFQDAPTLVFVNRRLPVPRFTTAREDGWLVIRTDALELRYREGSGKFQEMNLRVEFGVGGGRLVWHPGMSDTANLKGTTRTLDGVLGATALEPGLLSRDGWVLVDDTDRPIFDDSSWPWVEARPSAERQDYYLFAHGREYRKALGDFVRVAGRIPMPSRFAFGFWWSRYWAYSDREFRELVEEFFTYQVPLDVLVIDMDWHQTFDLRWDTDKRDQAGQRLGWTGYTWNRSYFPDPPAFLGWCEERGLKTPLNLHPASGIQPHEEAYPAMARAMGILPESRQYVPFDIVDKRFAENYLNLVLRPLERQGVDFWWLDWQQWGTTTIPGVTPTWWLNYVHFTDMERQGKARPLIFHRWGGLGNHRYQIGFSGDAISVWESLRFQPYFTATAANVGFGYWSHDIGGHMPGPVSPELYTRWIQFGAFSPILRTHTTKNPAAERRIWAYPPENFTIMRDAVRLRYSLIPYLYTAARAAYDSGISVCRPMYLHWPEREESYSFSGQYMFGDDILVAPVVDSIVERGRRSAKQIWIPPGAWYEWYTGTMLRGPAVVERSFALDEIPVYAKAGAIIPMQEGALRAGADRLDTLVLTFFPGDSGSCRLYEDQGNSTGYQRDECVWTGVRQRVDTRGRRVVEIHPSEGGYPGMERERQYELRFPGSWPPASVTWNGKSIPYRREGGVGTWRYDGERVTTVVVLPVSRTDAGSIVELEGIAPQGADAKLLDGVPGRLARLRRVIPWLNGAWPREWAPDELIAASQTGLRISFDPTRARPELEAFEEVLTSAAASVRRLRIDPALTGSVLDHLRDDTGGSR